MVSLLHCVRCIATVIAPAAMMASLAASPALACPNCPTGRAARATVFDHDFGANLLMIASPLLVLGLIATLLHRIDIEPRRRRIARQRP